MDLSRDRQILDLEREEKEEGYMLKSRRKTKDHLKREFWSPYRHEVA
jgi:hypothetical protein